jgi:hypothetical protein
VDLEPNPTETYYRGFLSILLVGGFGKFFIQMRILRIPVQVEWIYTFLLCPLGRITIFAALIV